MIRVIRLFHFPCGKACAKTLYGTPKHMILNPISGFAFFPGSLVVMFRLYGFPGMKTP